MSRNLATLILVFLCITSNQSHSSEIEINDSTCESLRNLAIDSAFVTSANIVPENDSNVAYCQVRATALPAISIEVRLPITQWNGRYYQTGCGAGCGILGRADSQNSFINAMNPGLSKGYATATSDSGHHSENIFDLTWAYHNPLAERDWAWRSIGETHRVAKKIIDTVFGTEAENNFFQGCSTGGRLANMAALKYPEIFDGIISGAPVLDQAGLVGIFATWIAQSNMNQAGEPILKPGKDNLIGDEVLNQCDLVDGQKDGIIADPRSCNVDLSVLECADSTDTSKCLTNPELEVVAKWRQGPRDSTGKQLYPGGIPEGSERFWWLWLTGKEGGGPGRLLPMFAESYLKYMAFEDDPGPSYSVQKFNIESDAHSLEAKSNLYSPDSPDLTAFQNAGGKMIVWHGWADAMVTPYKTIEWYEQVANKFGGEDKIKDFLQLYMIPGMDHCGVLPGESELDQFSIDPLTALETWVETKIAPQSIFK